jgi:hypothetical protein
MPDLDKIRQNLKSRKVEDRLHAVGQLARVNGEEKVLLLKEALRDRSHYVAAQAAEALGNCADWEDGREICDVFLRLTSEGAKGDPGCHIRAHLAVALAKIEYSLAAEALRAGIRTVQIEAVGGVPFDTGAHLRANCALAMASLHIPDAVRDIALLLFDRKGHQLSGQRDAELVKMEPRKAAAQALGMLGDAAALPLLAVKLTFPENETPDVLATCMETVVALEDPRCMELLTPYLSHADQLLAAQAALVIARTRDPQAASLLAETVWRLGGNARKAVLLALLTLRTEEADREWARLESEADRKLHEMMEEVKREIG